MRKPGAGRPRTPTSIKKLAGTIQPCRTNPKEPKQKCVVPSCSFPLDKEGRKAWKILSEIVGPKGMRICTKADVFGMTLFCQSWSGYIRARRELQKIGSVYASHKETTTRKPGKAKKHGKHPGGAPVKHAGKLEKVMWREHPLAKLAGEEREFVMTFLAKFGLTPADRSRVEEIIEADTSTPEGRAIQIGKKRRAG